jgi:cell division protein FtsB
MLVRVGMRARWVVASVVGALFLIFFVFPTRSLLAQRAELSDARQELEVLDEQNQRLELERQKLQTADEVERLARTLHNMIWPGETPYVVVPTPTTTPATVPVSPPSDGTPTP